MARLAVPALAWALVSPAAQASRIRRAAGGAEVQHDAMEKELEVVSKPMRMYRKDCWKRPKHPFSHRSLLELEEEYPGAGVKGSGWGPGEMIVKDGYYPVDCLKDYMYEFGDKYGNNKFQYNQANISGVSIVHYSLQMRREFHETMTHDVCFKFCRLMPEMQFFGIVNGKDCYCAPYYKAMAGDSSVCDLPCEGDQTVMCGSKTKSSIFEMHLCAKTGKELTDAMETGAEAKEEIEELSDQVLEAAHGIQFAAENLQAMFSQRDYVASDQMQDAKVYAGKLLEAVKAADKLEEEITELDGKAKANEKANEVYQWQAPQDLNEAEEIIAAMQKAVTAAAASAEELKSLLSAAAPELKYNETTPGDQYMPVMYFIDKEFVNDTSTCGGKMVGQPKVGTFDACAEACDFEVGKCVGFNFFANTTDTGLCVMFSKLKTAVYYTGCDASLVQRSSSAVADSKKEANPLDTKCVAKLANFEGTTLKPDPSGKCDMCLKSTEEAKKCYTEYGGA